MIAELLKLLRRAHASLRQVEYVYMVLLAVVIGLGGGMAAVGFRKLIGLGNWIGWFESEYSLELIRQIPFWWKIPIPAVGGLLCGLIIYYFAREAKGHGVPEVMEAVALRGGRIRPRVVLAKMLASAICISSGGSVGREGPIVQIGSALGSWGVERQRASPARSTPRSRVPCLHSRSSCTTSASCSSRRS
jgi:CIC family chloride channel protein